MIVKSYLAEKNLSFLEKKCSLIYGENIGLIQELKTKIKNNFPNSEIYNLNQNEIIDREELFLANILNLSLFEKEKIYLINQCNDKILNIIAQIEEKLQNQRIVLFSDVLEKKSKLRLFFEKSTIFTCIPCYEDNVLNLKTIIKERLVNYKGVNTHVINLLIDNCNLNRSLLNNEIQKIKIFFQDKIINLDKLSKIINSRENDNFNFLKDAAINGDKLSTNKLLSTSFLEPEKIAMYISIMTNRLLKIKELIKISRGKSLEINLDKIKPSIFWKDKPVFLNQAKKWDLGKINKALENLYRMEKIIKSNSYINKNILIKKTVLDICAMVNSS